MSRKSTKSRPSGKSTKPEKPYKGFPLFAHQNGSWAKKIRGNLHYFGGWDNPDAALERFNREWPYLKDGRTPPPVDRGDGCTVQALVNAFLDSKDAAVESGELSQRSFRDYYQTCAALIAQFGKERRVDDLRPDDFEGFRSKLAKRMGVVTLKNEINRCRVVFKYALDQRLIDRPVAYGQSFNRPSAKMLRKSRNEGGQRMFEAAELRLILDALDGKKVTTKHVDEKTGKPGKVTLKADPILKAMTLLGVNCGFGNTDISSLPQSAVDLDGGWIDFPRPKTEIPRRVPLWPETVEALKVAIENRPKPADPKDAALCFLTSQGNPWVRVQKHATREDELMPLDSLSQRFARMLKRLGINGRRGLGFYTLRHVFETIGGESKDQVAVSAVMGHVDSSMAGVYRERISDERLRAVVETVHRWLWPSE